MAAERAPDRFRLGVNYWPAETAMQWLAAYDGAIVRRDLLRVAGAGMDTVRIFLRWDDVQPEPSTVDHEVLASVVDTADAAAAAGVDLVVTLFTGHMSGVNWIPAWATGGDAGDARFRVVTRSSVRSDGRRLRSWYDDPDIVDAQARQAAEVAKALAGHPAVWAWDLGNENSNCTTPASALAGERWLERMTGALRTNDPGTLVTVGTHMEDLEADRGIGIAEAARWCDFVCMHGYPSYASWSQGPLDLDLVPFLQAVTRWLSADVPVLFEELGHPTAQPAHESTGHLVDERVDLATHERSFGLWRADGTPKPAVAALAALAGAPTVVGSTKRPWLDIEADEFLADGSAHLPRLYERFRAASGETSARPPPA